MSRDHLHRRGYTLLQTLTGMFVGSAVLGSTVPLYITAQRHADLEAVRSRALIQAREIGGQLRSDLRCAQTAEMGAGGQLIRLRQRRVDHPGVTDVITYRMAGGVLTRHLNPAGIGRAAERQTWSAPLREVQFERAGAGVRARLRFRAETASRPVSLEAEVRGETGGAR